MCVSALLFTGMAAAQADTAVWISKRHLGDDALHAAAANCKMEVGPDLNGQPVPRAYRACMGRQGWTLQKTLRERSAKTWTDPETGDTCHEASGGLGSSCGNLGW